ncbi:hypothetical protein [Methylobacterium sp. Leaf100]|uniref:hypothetical protein n=1 Tax=Methylobacterium sp. Leaf100 TaxID=1736252 RepID=UPI0006F867DF|nr:hypothetical protein [Methylobacterium sp. Leaf100]KQP24984.1 hypothetical protein ASF25_21405 [Methylobacterium sp. Leaf100]
MISRNLSPNDFAWALDASRRAYRVRPTTFGDLRTLGLTNVSGFITVVCLHSAVTTTMRAECGLFPDAWEDTDSYARRRLNAIAGSRTRRTQTAGTRGRSA